MENKIKTASGYDKILLDLIPKLDEYKSYSGADGTAYMIDDKFVVKKINYSRNYQIFDKIFEFYFDEMKSYAEKGYNVPRFYAWTKLEKEENFDPDALFSMPYEYYILQEKLPGRELYLTDKFRNLYDCFKNICSEEDYKKMLINPSKYENLLQEVVQIYVKDFVDINSRLEAMSDVELERFVVGIYEMFKNGRYNLPDIYKSNVLIDDKNQLGIIDNSCLDKEREHYIGKGSSADEFLTVILFELLNENSYMKDNQYVQIERIKFNPKLKQLIRENEELNEVLLSRIVSVIKKQCGKISIKNKALYAEICEILSSQLGGYKVEDFLQSNGIELC